MVDPQRVFAVTRPDPALLRLYIIYSVLSLVFLPVVLPALLIRYYTMRYRFDDEGVRTSWGWLFKRENVVRYARIQDLHISRGLLERWMGLAAIEIQTAAGSPMAEERLVGIRNYEEVRDFLYERMRGAKPAPAEPQDDAPALLREIRDELRAIREARG